MECRGVRRIGAARGERVSALSYIIPQTKVAGLRENPRLYRVGRIAGTREMVVGSNYLVVYAEDDRIVTILRVLHAARQWPEA